jgi:GNAT superfamily N-acetyltransferase
MREVYDASYPWNRQEKSEELFAPDSRLLIASHEGSPIGFVHFKFEHQYGDLVLFIYTVQIESEYQRKKLGRFLIHAAEFIGLDVSVNAIMTAVHKVNEAGNRLFRSMKYRPHHS